MYKQVLDPVSNSLALSAIFAAIPLLVLFVLLGVLRVTAWVAALVALAVAIGVAVFVYPMPVDQALLAGSEGAVFGFFPILWIVINAIWIYNMTVVTGHFDVLRRSFGKISDDQRIQAVIIAFCFGALLEALAGFGTPVAISSVMLIALGFRPIKAATVALVANTAPVAFGALAVPITTLAPIAGLPEQDLASMIGRQTPLLGMFVPMALVFIVDGARGVRATLPATLTCGFVFALMQFLTSNYISIPLTDIVASLAGAASIVLLLRFWQPSESYVETSGSDDEAEARAERRRSRVGGDDAEARHAQEAALRVASSDDTDRHDPPAEVFRAYAPYLIIIAVFVVTQLPGILDALESTIKLFNWPGLHVTNPSGDPLSSLEFKFNWLPAAGTLLVISGLITIPVIGISPVQAFKTWLATYVQLATAIVTVMAVLALAYVMNDSGQTGTLGNWMAGAGGAFAFISPVLGWLGVAVTGSDTSSNSLFGALQVSAAHQVGLSPTLMAAANSSGGVLGKMISPQNLAIAAAAVGMSGREGDLFRKVLGWSIGFLVFMALLVYLQSTSVLSWMVP
ncbi:MAG: L-lactate permease [Propionibacteriales bacterium]|nr:L-lactate permease [Propionibacteriales bacterium]